MFSYAQENEKKIKYRNATIAQNTCSLTVIGNHPSVQYYTTK